MTQLKNFMNKTLIIGAGETGQALGRVLSSFYQVEYVDSLKGLNAEGEFEVINICYPPDKNFINNTKAYIKRFKPKLTIIHSSVPVGTTRQLGKGVVNSPINGQHANMAEELKIYPKFIGVADVYDEFLATRYLKNAGFNTITLSSPEATELAKLMCTSYYGWNLIYSKEMIEESKKYNVPFHEVYTVWNQVINKGFEKLGKFNHIRPIYEPVEGEIGGHCVVNNAYLLDNFITRTIKGRNEIYKLNKEEKDENRTGDKNLASRKIRNSKLRNRE